MVIANISSSIVLFLQPIYEAIIPENVPVGSYIARVTAGDADEQGTINARIDYSLSGPGSNMFVMHKKTGTYLHLNKK